MTAAREDMYGVTTNDWRVSTHGPSRRGDQERDELEANARGPS